MAMKVIEQEKPNAFLQFDTKVSGQQLDGEDREKQAGNMIIAAHSSLFKALRTPGTKLELIPASSPPNTIAIGNRNKDGDLEFHATIRKENGEVIQVKYSDKPIPIKNGKAANPLENVEENGAAVMLIDNVNHPKRSEEEPTRIILPKLNYMEDGDERLIFLRYNEDEHIVVLQTLNQILDLAEEISATPGAKKLLESPKGKK